MKKATVSLKEGGSAKFTTYKGLSTGFPLKPGKRRLMEVLVTLMEEK